MYGPTKPPRFPTELINPMETAALAPLSRAEGRAQKLGKKDQSPAATTQSMTSERAMCAFNKTVQKNATPAQSRGIVACHMRSPVRSEDQPTQSMIPRA